MCTGEALQPHTEGWHAKELRRNTALPHSLQSTQSYRNRFENCLGDAQHIKEQRGSAAGCVGPGGNRPYSAEPWLHGSAAPILGRILVPAIRAGLQDGCQGASCSAEWGEGLGAHGCPSTAFVLFP